MPLFTGCSVFDRVENQIENDSIRFEINPIEYAVTRSVTNYPSVSIRATLYNESQVTVYIGGSRDVPRFDIEQYVESVWTPFELPWIGETVGRSPTIAVHPGENFEMKLRLGKIHFEDFRNVNVTGMYRLRLSIGTRLSQGTGIPVGDVPEAAKYSNSFRLIEDSASS